MSVHAEHLEHYDIETLNKLEHERGQIAWTAVTAFIENQLSDDDWRLVADLLTGSEDGVPDHTRPDVRCFYYYLYCLHHCGALDAGFRAIYRQRFERQRATEDTDLNVSTPQQMISRLNSWKNESLEAKDRAAALNQLLIDLADVLRISDELGIPRNPPLDQIEDFLTDSSLLDGINGADFYRALHQFAQALGRQRKGVTNKILARPLPGYVPVLLGIRAEHAGLGKAGKALDRDSAKDFSRFLIGSSWNYDHNGNRADIVTKKSFRAIIGQFELLKELSEEEHIHRKELEHILKDVPPEKIALLLGYLYWQISTARHKWMNQGIASVYLKEAREFIRHLEEILAERMTKFLTEGDSAKMWERSREIAHPWAYSLLARVAAGGAHGEPEAVAHELKEIPKGKLPEGYHSHKKRFKVVADVAAVVAGTGHLLEVIGIPPKIRQEAPKVEKKDDKGGGGGHDKPH